MVKYKNCVNLTALNNVIYVRIKNLRKKTFLTVITCLSCSWALCSAEEEK
jgi:hypothetical protein